MAMAWNRGVGAGLAGASAIVAVAVPTETAHAQMGMMMQGQGANTAITKKGYDAYVRLLGLDADQKEVARDLLDGNRAANKSLLEDMKVKITQAMEKAREAGDWEAMQKDSAKMGEEFTEKAKKLETQFFDDLKGLLTPEQLEKFPTVERHRRREMAMRFGLAIGASTDVVEIARLAKLDVEKNEELKEAIERYEMDLDTVLKGYEKMAIDAQRDAGKAGWDTEKISAALKPLNDAAKQVKDINRAAAKRVAGLITDEAARKAFELEVKRREFPRIYKEAAVQRSMNAALKITGLDESQKDQLATLTSQYERDANSVNERWAKAMEEREEKAGGRINQLMNMWDRDANKSTDVADAKKAREEIDEAATKKLEGILTEDQRAQLPQNRPAKSAMGFGSGMFEDFGWDFAEEEDDK